MTDTTDEIYAIVYRLQALRDSVDRIETDLANIGLSLRQKQEWVPPGAPFPTQDTSKVEEELNRIRMEFHEVFSIAPPQRSPEQQTFLQDAFNALYKPTQITDLNELVEHLSTVRKPEPKPVVTTESSLRDRVMDRSDWVDYERAKAASLNGISRLRPGLPEPRRDGRVFLDVFHLQMDAHPDPARIENKYFDVDRGVTFDDDLGLVRLSHSSDTAPIIELSRYWYNRIGRPHLWYERNLVSDYDLLAYYRNPLVDMYAFTYRNAPIGFAELDWRSMGTVNLAYFGIFEECQGRGLGRWALNTIVDVAWTRTKMLRSMIVNTNTLDGYAAFPNYGRAGFLMHQQYACTFTDPRVMWPDEQNRYDLTSYPWPRHDEYVRLYDRLRTESRQPWQAQV